MSNPQATFVWNTPLTDGKIIYGPSVPESVVVPAGTYYIGDPCYPIGDSPIYEEAWANVGYAVPAVYRSPTGIVYIDRTAYGDGGYEGSDGFEYGVDAGVISIISLEIIQEFLNIQNTDVLDKLVRGGKLHTFLHPVKCIFGDGEFEFQDMSGHDILRINTNDDDEDEDDSISYDDKTDEEEEEEEEEMPRQFSK